MNDDSQLYAPWGVVTSDFWATPEAQEAKLGASPAAAPAPAPARVSPPEEPEQMSTVSDPSRQEPITTARQSDSVPKVAEFRSPAVPEQPPAAPPGDPVQDPASPAIAPPMPAAPPPSSAPQQLPQQLGPPPESQEWVARITASFAAPRWQGQLATADADAEKLDAETTARYGEKHPHTIHIREIRGWIAYLSGHHGAATRWYLHTTGLLYGLYNHQHPLTQASAQRAAHMWLSIMEPEESAALGAEVLRMVGATLPEHDPATMAIRDRLGPDPVPSRSAR